MPAAITSWTAAGASIGAIASPLGVSVAWFGLAVIPLSVSCWRIADSLIGCGSEFDTGPTLTPAVSPAGWLGAAAAPATGSITCGCACSTGAPDADDPVGTRGPPACWPQPPKPTAPAHTTAIVKRRMRRVSRAIRAGAVVPRQSSKSPE